MTKKTERPSQKKQHSGSFELTYSSEWTKSLESKEHWIYYWNQAKLVWDNTSQSEELLEVGVGSGFLANYLKSRGWSVTTIDIDEDKNPDILGDISSINLSKSKANCVLAFEIFEHIPFPLLLKSLNNIKESNISKIIFSVPYGEYRGFSLNLKLPKTPPISIGLRIPKNKIITPNHYWELKNTTNEENKVVTGEKRGFVSYQKLINVMENNGFKVKRMQKEDYIQFFIAERM